MTSERVVAELNVPGQAGSLRLIRALLREAAMAHGADPEWTHDLVLAVDEACQNVIRHGYHREVSPGDIHVQVAADSGGLVIRVSDDAATVGPEGPTPLPLDPSRPGGLGLHLMRSLTDECRWETPRAGRRNTLRLRKAFRSAGTVATGSVNRSGEENPK